MSKSYTQSIISHEYDDDDDDDYNESSSPKKSKIEGNGDENESPSIKILQHHYELNRSKTKWLDIFISVSDNPEVIIRLYNEKYFGIDFDYVTWRNICKYKDTIQTWLKSPYVSVFRKTAFVINKPLKMEMQYCHMHSKKAIKFTCPTQSLVFMKSTFDYLINLDDCITLLYNKLTEQLKTVEDRFKLFTEISEVTVEEGDVSTQNLLLEIKKDARFNFNSQIDCEMIALATPQTFLSN